MIRLSASLINDFLTCSQRAYYRINHPEQSVETSEMAVGSVVHKAIEKHWNNKEAATELLLDQCLRRGLYFEKAQKLLENFFINFQQFLREDDVVEKLFELSWNKDAVFVGKMDRVNVEAGIVFDWKTSSKPPKSITANPQFILYNYAFKRLYGAAPSLVAYASLSTGKLIKYESDSRVIDEFFGGVVPRIIDAIKGNHFSKDGLFGYECWKNPAYSNSCYYCSFQDFCLREDT